MQVMLNQALSGVEGGVEGMMRKASEEVSSLRAAYQDEVRERDQQLEEAQQTILELRGESAESQQRLLQSREDIESLQAENERLRLQCNRVGEGEVLSNDAASLPTESPASERVVRKWTCEWRCGFQGTSFDAVVQHERVCGFRQATLPTENLDIDESAPSSQRIDDTLGPDDFERLPPLEMSSRKKGKDSGLEGADTAAQVTMVQKWGCELDCGFEAVSYTHLTLPTILLL